MISIKVVGNLVIFTCGSVAFYLVDPRLGFLSVMLLSFCALVVGALMSKFFRTGRAMTLTFCGIAKLFMYGTGF